MPPRRDSTMRSASTPVRWCGMETIQASEFPPCGVRTCARVALCNAARMRTLNPPAVLTLSPTRVGLGRSIGAAPLVGHERSAARRVGARTCRTQQGARMLLRRNVPGIWTPLPYRTTYRMCDAGRQDNTGTRQWQGDYRRARPAAPLAPPLRWRVRARPGQRRPQRAALRERPLARRDGLAYSLLCRHACRPGHASRCPTTARRTLRCAARIGPEPG